MNIFNEWTMRPKLCKPRVQGFSLFLSVFEWFFSVETCKVHDWKLYMGSY